MKKTPIPTTGSRWFDKFLEQPSPDAAAPALQRSLTSSELKAEKSTRASRQVTEAAMELRQTQIARLRGARLKWKADAQALAAGESKTKLKAGAPD